MNSWNQNQNQNNMVMGQAQFNPYMNQQWNIPQRMPIYHADPIHGEQAAWQFPIGPNSEIWLPDADKDIIWWIRTDNAGSKSIKPFKLSEYEEPTQIDMNDLATRLAAVEEWINGKQNKSNAKCSTTTATTTTATIK